MTNTELEQETIQTPTSAVTAENPAAPEEPAPIAGETTGESSGSDTHSRISVTHVGPEMVEATPLREVTLPDTPQMRRIRTLQVPIIVRLANRVMPMGEILQLAPGAIIEFEKSVEDSLDLMINNKCIGKGQAVKVSEKFGLKITNLASLDQMIRAMGGK